MLRPTWIWTSAVLLILPFGGGFSCADDEGPGLGDFVVALASDLAEKSFRFGPDSGLFASEDPRHGQSATLIVGTFNRTSQSAGFALTTDDDSIEGGVLSLGSCVFQTTYTRRAGEPAQTGAASSIFFECGLDPEGRLGLLEDDDSDLIISEPPTTPTIDLEQSLSMSPYLVVDPSFDPDTRTERGGVELKLIGNVLSFSVAIQDASSNDVIKKGHVRMGSALENGELIFTLFGTPIQPVREVGTPFLDEDHLATSVFVTPEEVASLLDEATPIYINLTSTRNPDGLLRGQLRNLPVGLEGGRLAYPNGVVLEIPAGALSQSTDIEVTDLPSDEVNELLSARADSFLNKRVLGGFLIEPTMVFAVPIKGIVPVLPLAPYELMWRMEVDFDSGRVWPTDTQLRYSAARGAAEIEIPHTSNQGVLGGSGLSALPPGVNPALLDLQCMISSLPICEALDPLQPACCMLFDFLRPEDCECCREGAQTHQSDASDFSRSRASETCEFLNDRVITVPHDCRTPNGQAVPPEAHAASEVSPNCPPEMKIEVEIEPKRLEIQACDSARYTATMRGVMPDGTELIPKQPFNPVWRSLDPTKADFVTNPQGRFDGTLEAFAVGSLLVEAQTGLEKHPLGIASSVTVLSNVSSFSIDPSTVQLDSEGEAPVRAQVEIFDGRPPDGTQLSWTSNDRDVADVSDDTGLSTSIVAGERGCTEILARYQHDCETVELTIPVCVECSPLEMTVTPSEVGLLRGETSDALEVEITDDSGAPVDPSSIRWASLDRSVATVSDDEGPSTSVAAVDSGQTEVSAIYEDDCQLKTVHVGVNVGCVNLKLSFLRAILEVEESTSITVTAEDAKGDPAELRESDLTWRVEDPNVAVASPRSGRSTVRVEGVGAGTTLLTASYDDGSCPVSTVGARILVTENEGIGGVWRITPTSGSERCRHTGQDWWEDEEEAQTFRVRISEAPDSDEITATYVPDVGPLLLGHWDANSGEFDLRVDSTDPNQCAYLVYGSDICGEAINCTFVSCRIFSEVTGTTEVDEDRLEASSRWHYWATFSFGEDHEGQNTWECAGSAIGQGTR